MICEVWNILEGIKSTQKKNFSKMFYHILIPQGHIMEPEQTLQDPRLRDPRRP